MDKALFPAAYTAVVRELSYSQKAVLDLIDVYHGRFDIVDAERLRLTEIGALTASVSRLDNARTTMQSRLMELRAAQFDVQQRRDSGIMPDDTGH